ncbi:MAG: hypothetical protein IPQ07_21175 [Myxococcales bacterium]|nr:hypothetical protein [Myxococcales bacterium]
MASDELWHLVEARRDDGAPAMFRIRELAPRPELSRIFVVEIPYPVTGLSRLPDATAYRRLAAFEEQWLTPAITALGWTFVAAKTEDGSFFLYLYGAGEPNAMIERLSPFDGALGFFDEHDPAWDEYAALKELLDEANAMPPAHDDDVGDADDDAPATEPPRAKPKAAKKPAAKKPAAKKPAAKKPAARKPAARKPAARKPAARKPAAKKPAAKKPAAKKPAARKRR